VREYIWFTRTTVNELNLLPNSLAAGADRNLSCASQRQATSVRSPTLPIHMVRIVTRC